MNAKLLGLFSGFPTHHFPDEIALVLREKLPRRESLVFISAWPEEYARNDEDSDGMHEMFAERGLPFAAHRVIDRRTSPAEAARLVRDADCFFLMGGNISLQMTLLRDLGLVSELRASHAVILGVSAGSMNMGRYVADVWESKALYEGIGLTGITTKGHYTEDAWFLPVLKEISMTRPIVAMEDESAIFLQGGAVRKIGKLHWIDKGEIRDWNSTSVPELSELSIEKEARMPMDYRTESLILHFVTEDDLPEVARTWTSEHHPLSDAEAREAIAYMQRNYARNAKGCVYHLCLAICAAEHPQTILGWCGLDGTRNHAEPELFILLDEAYRNRGYGTKCVRELLRIAVEDYALPSVHGGCAKENVASARVMEKGGMLRYGTEENGDPLFRYSAQKHGVPQG